MRGGVRAVAPTAGELCPPIQLRSKPDEEGADVHRHRQHQYLEDDENRVFAVVAEPQDPVVGLRVLVVYATEMLRAA